jgi:hypothetical protein
MNEEKQQSGGNQVALARFEYRYSYVASHEFIIETLNRHGQEGWEVCCGERVGNGFEFFLKRQLP